MAPIARTIGQGDAERAELRRFAEEDDGSFETLRTSAQKARSASKDGKRRKAR
jgi:hypothetical protein